MCGSAVVDSVLASTGLPDVLRQDGLTRSQHLVTLSSIEGDALGDRLRVIWEVEPGTSIPVEGSDSLPLIEQQSNALQGTQAGRCAILMPLARARWR